MRWQEGGKALSSIRTLIGLNLSIGLITIAIGAGGKYFL